MKGPARLFDRVPLSSSVGARSLPWLAVAAALALGAVATIGLDPRALDWQPELLLTQPWRWWSAAWVHWSDRHLAANLVGAALVAVFGWRARCDRMDALAWFIAWPVTHLILALQPGLRHYGGLSGVLHAGVVVAAVAVLHLDGGRRWLGPAILAGVAVKVLSEQPWGAPLQHWSQWDFAVAPLGHLSGALAGAACAAAAAVWRRAAFARSAT